MKKNLNYIKENKVSLYLTGKERKPTSAKFKGIIKSLNELVEHVLLKIESTEKEAQEAREIKL